MIGGIVFSEHIFLFSSSFFFNFSEVEHDLESNFCRNPGYGTEPWCYTNAETCARAYCDSCQLSKYLSTINK